MKEVFFELVKRFKVFTLQEKALSIGIVICLLLISSALAYNGGKRAEINLEAVDVVANRIANQDEQIKANNDKLADLQSQIDTINNELSSQQDLLNAFNDYKNNKEAKDAEIVQLDSKIQEKTNNIESLDSQVQEKQNELNSLTGAITIAKSEKILTAGVYIVGSDVDPGTYDVQLVSGSGNFFARGSRSVNEIFGNKSSYIQEYKNMRVSTGDEIEIKGDLKVKLLLK